MREKKGEAGRRRERATCEAHCRELNYSCYQRSESMIRNRHGQRERERDQEEGEHGWEEGGGKGRQP